MNSDSPSELFPEAQPLKVVFHQQDLEKVLKAAIKSFDPDGSIAYVADDVAGSLAEFCIAALLKFVKGQREHGGDFRNIDHVAEMRLEQIDFFFYNEGNKWKHRNSTSPKA